ncbi:hypothetical protein Bca52824_001276 [Brassica carinata]|uniref:CCHC-type domain-containing protein n=1 Tax=Brassica carinata TaxID=52824 RepID=A0A8X7WI82_BRACI|nr:hypothetical protein Bca52824_001276 [Brassica carinata]
MTAIGAYHPTSETGDSSSLPPMETATTQPPSFPTVIVTGGPSTFVHMEPSTTVPPIHQTFYEIREPSSFPAVMGAGHAPRLSTSFGDPYATESYFPGQGSDIFHGVGDTYLDPHGYPYHTKSYLGGPDLSSRCFTCGDVGHLAIDCPRAEELQQIPYLVSAQPAGGSTEWGYCPNCSMLLYIGRPWTLRAG